MNRKIRLLLVSTLSVGAIALAADPVDPGKNGQFLFDNETFSGNGRTCQTCHTLKTGTFSIEEAQQRFAKDPSDPLFRVPDSDHLDGLSYERLLKTGTIKIDVPLAPNVMLAENPSARTATVFRAPTRKSAAASF